MSNEKIKGVTIDGFFVQNNGIVRDSESGLLLGSLNDIRDVDARVKKAFWWSAEYTASVHDNKIQFAWTDYLELVAKKII